MQRRSRWEERRITFSVNTKCLGWGPVSKGPWNKFHLLPWKSVSGKRYWDNSEGIQKFLGERTEHPEQHTWLGQRVPEVNRMMVAYQTVWKYRWAQVTTVWLTSFCLLQWCKSNTLFEITHWIFIFSWVAICGSKLQLPVSHAVTRVNNQYMYGRSVPRNHSIFHL